jgi:hypothetical protein
MYEIIKIKGPLPDAHKAAIRLLGDPMIEIQLYDGQPSEDDQETIDNLRENGHIFQVVTFEGSDRAYLVASV